MKFEEICVEFVSYCNIQSENLLRHHSKSVKSSINSSVDVPILSNEVCTYRCTSLLEESESHNQDDKQDNTRPQVHGNMGTYH